MGGSVKKGGRGQEEGGRLSGREGKKRGDKRMKERRDGNERMIEGRAGEKEGHLGH